jgi:DNA-binding transcriptional ArsR family regulator
MKSSGLQNCCWRSRKRWTQIQFPVASCSPDQRACWHCAVCPTPCPAGRKRSSYGHYLKVRSIAVPKASSTLSMQLAPSSDTRPLRAGMVISSGSFGAGFPRRSPGRPGAVSDFLDNYVADIINRDVMQISEIEKGPAMRAIVRMLAVRSGQLLVPAVLAKNLGLPQPTVTRYLTLLEEVFLIKRLPSWSRRPTSRAIRTPGRPCRLRRSDNSRWYGRSRAARARRNSRRIS